MNIKQLALVSIVGVSGMLVSACNVIVGGGGGTVYDPYYSAWYDVYGNYCGNGYPSAGCNFYSDGTKITAGQDPYYANSFLTYDYWSYTDSYGFYREYMGYGWVSPSGILYDDYGNALNETDSEDQGRDVIVNVAKQEKSSAEKMGKNFAEKYALSAVNGVKIAGTLQDWAKIGRDRSRTNADVNQISKRLYGVDIVKAESAITKAALGDKTELEDVNADVAANWGTSPEVSKKILKTWYRDQLKQVGID